MKFCIKRKVKDMYEVTVWFQEDILNKEDLEYFFMELVEVGLDVRHILLERELNSGYIKLDSTDTVNRIESLSALPRKTTLLINKSIVLNIKFHFCGIKVVPSILLTEIVHAFIPKTFSSITYSVEFLFENSEIDEMYIPSSGVEIVSKNSKLFKVIAPLTKSYLYLKDNSEINLITNFPLILDNQSQDSHNILCYFGGSADNIDGLKRLVLNKTYAFKSLLRLSDTHNLWLLPSSEVVYNLDQTFCIECDESSRVISYVEPIDAIKIYEGDKRRKLSLKVTFATVETVMQTLYYSKLPTGYTTAGLKGLDIFNKKFLNFHNSIDITDDYRKLCKEQSAPYL